MTRVAVAAWALLGVDLAGVLVTWSTTDFVGDFYRAYWFVVTVELLWLAQTFALGAVLALRLVRSHRLTR